MIDSIHSTDTIEYVNNFASGIEMYRTKFKERINAKCSLPFRIAAEPFKLPELVEENLEIYGIALASFYNECDQILSSLPEDHIWSKRMKRGPDWMNGEGKHLFVRPDFVLMDGHPLVTEIETSPFGLGLARFLHDSYAKAGHKVRGGLVHEEMPRGMTFGYTDHTSQYRGQLEQIAALTGGRAKHMSDVNGELLYRCFYLHEAAKDPSLYRENMLPPARPEMEEKAMMAMLFDDEFNFSHREILESIIPKTYVLGQEQCPFGEWMDIAKMSRTQRTFVLKISGFSPKQSWAKGVTFLHKLSREKCEEVLSMALADTENVYVLQEFKKGAEFNQQWYDFDDGRIKNAHGRVRFTPYYSVKNGRLLEAKTTLCENTDLLHGSVDSVNSPISYE